MNHLQISTSITAPQSVKDRVPSVFRLQDRALLQKGAALASSWLLDPLPHWLSRLKEPWLNKDDHLSHYSVQTRFKTLPREIWRLPQDRLFWLFIYLFIYLFWLLLWVFVGVCGLNCSLACEILVPQPGMETEYPVLEGGFLTSGTPEKALEPLILNLKDWDQVPSFHEWDLGPWDLPHLPTWLPRGAGYKAHICLLPPSPAGASFRLRFSLKLQCFPLPLQGFPHPWPNLTALITNDPCKGHSPSIGKARTTEQGVLDYSAIYTEVCDHVIKLLKDSSF